MNRPKRLRRQPIKSKRTVSSQRARPDRCLAELAEAQEILLPELAARIAAIEHLLIDKGLCTYDELKQARAFIDTRRGPR